MTKHQFAKECAEEIALNDLYANLTQEEYVTVIEQIILLKLDESELISQQIDMHGECDNPFTAAVMQCTLYKMQLWIARDALEHIARHGGECSTDEHARVALKKIKEMEK